MYIVVTRNFIHSEKNKSKTEVHPPKNTKKKAKNSVDLHSDATSITSEVGHIATKNKKNGYVLSII